MNPPTEQLIRDYLNRLSVAARGKLGFSERQSLLDRTRARIEAECDGSNGASAIQVRRALAGLGDPIAIVEREHARICAGNAGPEAGEAEIAGTRSEAETNGRVVSTATAFVERIEAAQSEQERETGGDGEAGKYEQAGNADKETEIGREPLVAMAANGPGSSGSGTGSEPGLTAGSVRSVKAGLAAAQRLLVGSVEGSGSSGSAGRLPGTASASQAGSGSGSRQEPELRSQSGRDSDSQSQQEPEHSHRRVLRHHQPPCLCPGQLAVRSRRSRASSSPRHRSRAAVPSRAPRCRARVGGRPQVTRRVLATRQIPVDSGPVGSGGSADPSGPSSDAGSTAAGSSGAGGAKASRSGDTTPAGTAAAGPSAASTTGGTSGKGKGGSAQGSSAQGGPGSNRTTSSGTRPSAASPAGSRPKAGRPGTVGPSTARSGASRPGGARSAGAANRSGPRGPVWR